MIFCLIGITIFGFKGLHYHYSIIYYTHHCCQKRLPASYHLHFQNRLQASCHNLIPMQAPFCHPLNLTLTNLLNKFATNIRGKSFRLFKQSFRLYLFNSSNNFFIYTRQINFYRLRLSWVQNHFNLNIIYFVIILQ